MKRYFVQILLLVMSVGCLNAAPDFATLMGKATRFYDNQEWASAMAMYEMMLQEKPTDIGIISKGIVVSGIMANHNEQLLLFEKSEHQGIPYDSIFSNVRQVAISLVKPEIYINFLNLIKDRQPWLTRSINVRLLDFYIFRSDADNMIILAKELLKTTPDNIRFMRALGDAYSLKGDYTESMKWYGLILTKDPDNSDALLILGNYYNIEVTRLLKAKNIKLSEVTALTIKGLKNHLGTEQYEHVRDISEIALSYLERANTLTPTPYLSTQIAKLRLISPKQESVL